MTAPRTLPQALAATPDPAWRLEQPGFDPLRESSRESRFAISNGFLGVRGGRAIHRIDDTAAAPRTYIAGLFDVSGTDQPIPALVPGPDWLRVSISMPKDPSPFIVDDVAFHHRKLDLRRGALLTESRLSNSPGLEIRMRVLRLVSLSVRALGLQLIHLDIESGAVEATLEASFAGLEFGLPAERLDEDLGVWRTRSSGKRLSIAAATSLRIDGAVLAPTIVGPFRWSWKWVTRPGQSVCFERMVAVTREDNPAGDPGKRAKSTLGAARGLGWNGVLAAHEAAWAARWHESDVAVDGDPAAQQALRFALYHLNGAANPADDHVSIAARALTGADYRGHVFWDTEIFLLPFYAWTWPEAARAMLTYRFRALNGARAKAKAMGWRGALYAWESADNGEESTPEHAIGPDRRVINILCGKQEQHISADVAYAVWHYWRVTGDDAFLRDAGAEILLETARFWSSRAGLEADGRHHIRGVIGPDEYHETIDDNAYTNVMARWNIKRALEVVDWLRRQWPDSWASLSSRIGLDDAELRQWTEVADTIVTGFDRKSGLFEQFSGFFELEMIDLEAYAGRSVPMDVVLGAQRIKTAQIVKQADVVALLALLPDEFPSETAAANFTYYERRCSHGSSLSGAMHGLAAARLGRSEMALRFFRHTSSIDLADTHAAIDGGVHIAALGGVWMMTVFGFAGLTMEDDGIRLDPKLPEAWRSVAFSVQWRGRRLSINIDCVGHTVETTLRSGDPMNVTVGQTRHRACMESPLRIGFAKTSSPAPPAVDLAPADKAALLVE
ncbi:MAG: glycoside hydrolase family 65 protein [Pseudomonadota bacterium]|nr:glycoside hydrolase family 65 protein [Pseudomonadota bacterium]